MTTKGRIIGGLVVAGVLLVIGRILLGLPGAVIVQMADNLIAPSGITAFKGDKAWPAGIYVSDAMPIGVILSAVVLAVVKPDASIGSSMLWGLLGYVLAGVAFTVVLVLLDRG
jgi:hypothetical protein